MTSFFKKNTHAASFALTAAIMALSSHTALSADIVDIQQTYMTPGICASQHVLSNVSHNFYHSVRHIPNMPIVRIKGFSDITQTRYAAPAETYNIARHYCSATAVLNDGSTHKAYYMIEHNQGFIGIGGMNVEFCIDGFDKWRIQDGKCHAIR